MAMDLVIDLDGHKGSEVPPMLEMRPGGPSSWRGNKPVKMTRKRIVCPSMPRTGEQPQQLFDGPGRSNSRTDSRGGMMQRLSESDAVIPQPQLMQAQRRTASQSPPPLAEERPLAVTVRLLYFSHDGNPADSGAAHDFNVTTHTTVESLLAMARKAAGVGNIGRIIFKGKPLSDLQQSLEAYGVATDPKSLHLMLSRKHRPSAVADAAAAEAAELQAAMAECEAEFKARPPRQKRVIDEEEPPATARSNVSGAATNSVASMS